MKFALFFLILLSTNAFATLRVAVPNSTSVSEFDLRDGELFTSDDFKTLYINSSSESVPVGNPSGVILPYGGTTAPTGYVMCDGQAYSRAAYPTLYAAIGVAFGHGNGTTTFNVPDLRGRFLRGVDGNAGRDPEKTTRDPMLPGGNSGNLVGSIQNDEVVSHSHGINGNGGDNSGTNNVRLTSLGVSATKTTNAFGGTETRPKNIYVNYIIKL